MSRDFYPYIGRAPLARNEKRGGGRKSTDAIFSSHFLHRPSPHSQTLSSFYKFKTFVHSNDSIRGDWWLFSAKPGISTEPLSNKVELGILAEWQPGCLGNRRHADKVRPRKTIFSCVAQCVQTLRGSPVNSPIITLKLMNNNLIKQNSIRCVQA